MLASAKHNESVAVKGLLDPAWDPANADPARRTDIVDASARTAPTVGFLTPPQRLRPEPAMILFQYGGVSQYCAPR